MVQRDRTYRERDKPPLESDKSNQADALLAIERGPPTIYYAVSPGFEVALCTIIQLMAKGNQSSMESN